ncbi:MAG: hypothetical protein JWM31_2308 [Solirubrobacterales bacterium]|nr:hypothetical protein [Solirubrobacterales bacterium]
MDDLDFRIVGELVRDGRQSFAELGTRIGLSPHAAADRVRRLRRSGVITGFTATVAPEHLGEHLDAMIDVRLRPETLPEQFEAVAHALSSVREVAFVTGRADYQVRVACRDADELDAVVRAFRLRGGVATTETRIVMRIAARPAAGAAERPA